ncbi:uncharacterized protein LOC134843717 [Symsagittifera roscoffensis]|uniref:uncharacterized protein LOC134843717 n=1 Tax=Symsagittifera roscoffensis TaxID=84072 RepID=UPI00307C8C93
MKENTSTVNYNMGYTIADATLTAVSVIPNFICLFHIYSMMKREKVIKYYLYFSLVITTCITSTVGNPMYLITKTVGLPNMLSSIRANYNLCTFLLGTYLCSNSVLPLTLVCLSLEQLYAVYYPNKAYRRSAQKTCLMAGVYLCVSWAIGAFNGWYLLILPNHSFLNKGKTDRCFFEEVLYNEMLMVYLCCNFYLPLALLLTSHCLLYSRLGVMETISGAGSAQNHNNNYDASSSTVQINLNMSVSTRYQYRSSMNSLLVLSSFCLLSWTPLMVIRTAEIFDNTFQEGIPGTVLNATVILWHSSTLFNPLYILFKEYRSGNFRPALPRKLNQRHEEHESTA